MSLRNLADQTLTGFDPKKDSVNSSSALPAGEYLMNITKLGHRVFKSGFDAIAIAFQVADGEQAGRIENVNISFAETSSSGNAIPEFVLDRNIKFISKLGALLGVDITADDFGADNSTDINNHIGEKLSTEIGKFINLKIIETPNKKDPNSPYRNYELEAAEQPEEIEIDDDDLPFN